MAKQEREPKVQRINWAAAANQVVASVNGKTTLTELAAKADELFVAHGGKTKLRSATYHCRPRWTRPSRWVCSSSRARPTCLSSGSRRASSRPSHSASPAGNPLSGGAFLLRWPRIWPQTALILDRAVNGGRNPWD